jgi:signal transduction histidine kinase
MATWIVSVRNSLRSKENSLSQRASSSSKPKSARRVSRPEARRQAALAVNASLNPDDTLATIVRQACALTACRRSAVYLLDGEVGALHLVAGHHLPDGLLGSKLSASRGVVGQAFRGQRVLVTDAADPLAAAPCLGPKLAAVPLITHRKRLGVLQVARGAKECRFSSGDIAELEWFAPLAAQALANARLFRLAEIHEQQVRTDMILTVSHELRNPINLTCGALDLLDQYLEAPSTRQREALDLAKLGIQRASALIGDLLDLERIERRVGMRPGRCDCALLLGSLGSEFRLWAQNHGKALQMQVPDTPLLVWGDEHLLQRVVTNLMDNALKYTPSGGCIAVNASAQAGQVILRVSDTGPGIPLEAQPHVFERFYRLSDQPDSVEGTGLGLTIVKSIVEQHGGRVWVTSQPGLGSTFTVSLPALDK